jgi:hypothetical protein
MTTSTIALSWHKTDNHSEGKKYKCRYMVKGKLAWTVEGGTWPPTGHASSTRLEARDGCSCPNLRRQPMISSRPTNRD